MKKIISIDKIGNEIAVGKYSLLPTNNLGYHHILDSNNKWGLINQQGQIILSCEFDTIYPTINDDLILVKKNGLFAYYNTNGTKVIDFLYNDATEFKNGIAAVKEENISEKYILINNKGEQISDNSIDYFFGFYGEDLGYFKNNGKYGFINNHGEIKIDNIYEEVKGFSEGIAAVKLNGYWGGINKNGKTVIDFKLDDSFDFSEGLSRLKGKGGYGFIDTGGNLVIPYQYSFAWRFKESLVSVSKNGSSWFIDKLKYRLRTHTHTHSRNCRRSAPTLGLRASPGDA
jgi:hypothetical protein